MQGDTRNDKRHECLERFDDFQKCVLVREQFLLQRQTSLSRVIARAYANTVLRKITTLAMTLSTLSHVYVSSKRVASKDTIVTYIWNKWPLSSNQNR